MTLNRLLNADGATVGYFTDDAAGRAAMQAARVEWNDYLFKKNDPYEWVCHSITTPIKSLELEDVEPGDGDQITYYRPGPNDFGMPSTEMLWRWLRCGAASVEVQRHEINRYRRPGKSNRSADLGGPAEAAGVLYVLTIKAPK